MLRIESQVRMAIQCRQAYNYGSGPINIRTGEIKWLFSMFVCVGQLTAFAPCDRGEGSSDVFGRPYTEYRGFGFSS